MFRYSMSFIGGGRVTRIVLSAAERSGLSLERAVATDRDRAALRAIEQRFPEVRTSESNADAATARIVFVALPPQEVTKALREVAPLIEREAVIISLAPKIDTEEIGAALAGHSRVARMIPNAPALVGAGFNPLAFSRAFPQSERAQLVADLSFLGKTPQVPEDQLEAWAVITGMGPTYFWFQMIELARLAAEFGLDQNEARRGIESMITGSARVLFESGLTVDEVLDTIPFHPLGKDEEQVRDLYRRNLGDLFHRLGRRPVTTA